MKLNIQKFATGGEIIIPVHLDSDPAEKDMAKLNKLLELQAKREHIFDDMNNDTQETAENIDDVSVSAEQLNEEFDDVKETIEKSNKGIGNVIAKVSKWGLAVFGIRSAYMLIRQSATQLAQDNDALAGKLNVIRGSLANAIAPIVETLVNLVYRLLSYINVITKTFFKIDLFKKTAKSGKSAVGSAQKLKKTLAGFDEMNILNDNSSSGGGAGGGGVPEPEPVDTGGFQKWLENTRTQWAELLEINRTEMAEMLLEQDKTWGLLKLGWFDTIQGIAKIVTGFLDIFEGVFKIIKGISEGNNDLIKEGVTKLIEGIKGILEGLIQTVLGIGEMILGVIWGVIKSIIDWVYNKIIKPIGEWFKNLWDGIVNGVKSAVDKVKSVFNTVVNFFKNIISTIVGFFKEVGTKVGDAVGGAFKSVINAVLKAVEKILNTPINAINKLIGTINKVSGVKIGKLSTFSFPRLAKGGIVNLPSRGVPVGGALAGERGAEGVIPLTDSQQMALLGEAIGRYITVNANITNTMNGRVISRELQKIQQENSFSSNR